VIQRGIRAPLTMGSFVPDVPSGKGEPWLLSAGASSSVSVECLRDHSPRHSLCIPKHKSPNRLSKKCCHCPKNCTDFQKSRCCGESERPLLFDPSNPSLAPASLLGLFSCWPLLAALKLRRPSSAVATRLKRVLVTKAPARRGVTRRAGRWMIRCN
jgi:hypothetical protein